MTEILKTIPRGKIEVVSAEIQVTLPITVPEEGVSSQWIIDELEKLYRALSPAGTEVNVTSLQRNLPDGPFTRTPI